MSLSDTCYDALSDLGMAFKHYCHWYENVEYVSGVIDAMFFLAETAVKLDSIDPIVSRDIHLTVSRVVLISLLLDANDDNEQLGKAIRTTLTKLAGFNSRFARALERIEVWLASSDGKRVVSGHFPEFKEIPHILEAARRSTAGVAA